MAINTLVSDSVWCCVGPHTVAGAALRVEGTAFTRKDAALSNVAEMAATSTCGCHGPLDEYAR
jgi:hypothetical protein